MRNHLRFVFVLAAIMALAIVSPLLPAETVIAQDGPSDEDLALARTYAPVLYFHPTELFRPQSVDVLVNTARLHQARRGEVAA